MNVPPLLALAPPALKHPGSHRSQRRLSRSIPAVLLGLFVAFSAHAQNTGSQPGVTQGVTSGINAPGQAPAQPTAGAGPIATTSSAAMLYPGDDFQMGPGDLINVRLFGSNDYGTTARVDITGNVELPYIGNVHLDKLNVHQAQQLIAERLRTGGFYLNPEIIIQVLESINSSVTVAGEIRQVVPITGARPLISIISAAGGLPPSASHTVRIVRPGRAEPIVVNLGTDLTNSEAANMLIYPRDIIQISRAGVIFVLGAFHSQGSLPLDQSMPLTLIQVAALSGGIGFEGRYEDLRLIRTFGNERRVVQVDIKKILNGKEADPILQANDIVFLPTNQMKAALKSLGIGGVIGMVTLLISLRSL
jgi:polysaccharide export outer membrane protein